MQADREKLNQPAVNADVAVSVLYLQSGFKAISRALAKLASTGDVDVRKELNEIEGLVDLFNLEIQKLTGLSQP